MNTVLMSLFSSIAWGVAPIFGWLGLRHLGLLQGMAIRTAVTAAFVFGTLFAAGTNGVLASASPKDLLFIALESLLATFAGDLAYYGALKYGSAASTASILAVSPVVTLWLAVVLLRERVSMTQIVGTAFIFVGLLLVAGNPFHG